MAKAKEKACENGKKLTAEQVRFFAEHYYAWCFGEVFDKERSDRLQIVSEKFCPDVEEAIFLLSCWKEFGFFDGDTAYQELRMKRSWVCAMALAVYAIFVLSTQKRWLLPWFTWVFDFEIDPFTTVAQHYGIDWVNWELHWLDPPPWDRPFVPEHYNHEQRWFIYGVWYCAKKERFWQWYKHAEGLEEKLGLWTEPGWFSRSNVEALMSDGAPLSYLPKVFQ